jgi:hypothetical protein
MHTHTTHVHLYGVSSPCSHGVRMRCLKERKHFHVGGVLMAFASVSWLKIRAISAVVMPWPETTAVCFVCQTGLSTFCIIAIICNYCTWYFLGTLWPSTDETHSPWMIIEYHFSFQSLSRPLYNDWKWLQLFFIAFFPWGDANKTPTSTLLIPNFMYLLLFLDSCEDSSSIYM